MFRLVARSIRRALALASLGGLALARPPQASAQSGTAAWRPQTVPLWGLTYSPDIGLLVGAGITPTRYGFRALPPSTRLLAEGACATGVRACRLDAAGEFRRPLSPSILFGELRVSCLELTRFYGTGNETAGSRPDSVYRVRQTQLLLGPRVAIPLAPRFRLTLGPLLEYTHTPVDAGTGLALARPYGAGDFRQRRAPAPAASPPRAAPDPGGTLAPSCWGRPHPLRELVGGGVDLPLGRGPAGGDAHAPRRRRRGERHRPVPGAGVRGG